MHPITFRLLRLVSFALFVFCGLLALWLFAQVIPHQDPAATLWGQRPVVWGYLALVASLISFGGTTACHLVLAQEPYQAEPML